MPKGIRWRSLGTRIVTWSFVPTAIILVAVAYVAFYAYQRSAEDLVIQRNQEVARLSASQLSTGLAEYTSLLNPVAQTLGMAGNDATARHTALKQVSYRLAVFDGGVVFLDDFGIVRESEPLRPGIMGEDWSDRSYYRQMFRSRGPIFSGVLRDGPGSTQVVAVAVPVMGPQGEFLGALAGMFRLDATAVSAFYGGILKLRLNQSGSIYLVDDKGHVIYHSNRDLIGSDFSAQPAVRQLLTGGAGSLRTRDTSGQELVAGFATIPGTPWGLVLEDTRDRLLEPGAGYRRFLLFLLAMGVIVPALVVLYGVRQITHPIAELTKGAQEIASGHFERRVATGTDDELEGLAAQFNTMAAELQESYALMERRVADRTRELATLNSIASTVNSSLDLEEILVDALARILEVTGFAAGVAYRLENVDLGSDTESDGFLKQITYRGFSPETARRASHLLVNDSAAGDAIRAQRPVVKQVAEYPDSPLKELVQTEAIRTVVSVPLLAKNRALGVINLGSRDDRNLGTEELALLSAIGQQVGMAMENARLYEKAEEMAAAAERSRLARDLHDAVTQTLFSASLIAEVLPKLWDRNPEEGRRRLEELRQLTRGALAEMRTLLLELRPSALTDAAMGDLLKQLGESVTGRARVPVTVKIENQCPLPPDVKVAIYRIAQEALNNIAKHSGASHAWVNLRGSENSIDLCIVDDGNGFDPATVGADHLGLGIMRERADAVNATLEVASVIGQGTTIEVKWQSDT